MVTFPGQHCCGWTTQLFHPSKIFASRWPISLGPTTCCLQNRLINELQFTYKAFNKSSSRPKCTRTFLRTRVVKMFCYGGNLKKTIGVTDLFCSKSKHRNFATCRWIWRKWSRNRNRDMIADLCRLDIWMPRWTFTECFGHPTVIPFFKITDQF